MMPLPWPADMNSFVEEHRKVKMHVLHILNAMAAKIVQKCSPVPLSVQQFYGTFVRAFGSFGMGVLKREYMPGDICGSLDVLVFLPKHIRRENIFQLFEPVLREERKFDDIVSIEHTYVPVIKFCCHNVDVNLVFAVLQLPVVPSDDRVLLHDDRLEGMDMDSQRSSHKWRVCKYLLDYVPDVYLFRNVLAEIWQWARNRMIYSSNCGYLGGTVWAIMVARVCGMHRNHNMTTCRLIVVFFDEYANWNWTTPVSIAEEVDGANFENQIMSVISPVSPHHNCAFNVTRTTFDSIKDALKDTAEWLQGIRDLDKARQVLAIKTDSSVLHKSIVERNDQKDKEAVLHILNSMAAWIVTKRSPLPLSAQESIKIASTTYVRSFGSFGMGVQERGTSDRLDMLMILPKHISRECIFAMVERMLKHHGYFDSVVSMENAFVPVIKFCYANVDVKLVFAVLPLPVVPADEHVLLQHNILEGMDDHSQRSINGWRGCKYLLDYVPDVYVFRAVLAEIREWARNRLVYSSKCGYLGGIVWAIMVARVCAMHHNENMTTRGLIQAFFDEYANWNWPTPVSTAEVFEVVVGKVGSHMPVISPVSPYQNVACNVTRTTFDFINDVLKDTHESLRRVHDLDEIREVLAVRTNPSDLYKSFVGIVARVPDSGRLKAWRGAVESQFEKLNKEFDQDYQKCRRAQIFPLSRVSRDGLECTWIFGVDFVGGPHHPQFLFYIERFRQNLYVRHQVSTSGPHHGNTLTFHCWTKWNVDLLQR